MRADLLLSALFTLLGALMYLEASRLPKGLFGTLGPGVFPQLVLAALVVTGAALTIRIALRLLKTLKTNGAAKTEESARVEQLSWHKRYRFVLLAFAQFFLYLLGLKWVGFLASTLIFMPVMMWTLAPPEKSGKTLGVIVFTTLLLTFGLYGLFTYAFNVMLPAGMIW